MIRHWSSTVWRPGDLLNVALPWDSQLGLVWLREICKKNIAKIAKLPQLQVFHVFQVFQYFEIWPKLWNLVNPDQFGPEGSEFITMVMVRLRISLGLSFEVVYNVSLGVFSKCICHRHCLSHCFLLVRSCFLVTLIKCLKGQKSQISLFESALQMYLSLSLSLYLSLSLSCWSGHVFAWPPSVLQGFGLVWKAGRLWIQHNEWVSQ